jgi:hypothetical protein
MIAATSSASAGSNARARWNHHGKEGKELRKDVMEGINNGMAPDCMTLFNKKHDIYGRVSKSCFRHHLNAYISDYTATMATKQPPTAGCGGSGLLGK